MDSGLVRQFRALQFCVALLVSTGLLGINRVRPFLGRQKFKVINAERIDIREKNGTLQTALLNAAGFKEESRTRGDGRISGLMLYNEQGDETCGLVYRGRAIPGGPEAGGSMTILDS